MRDIEKDCPITVSLNFSMSESDYNVLHTCYLPLVGTDGIALYGFLLAVGRSDSPFIFGQDIFEFTGLNEATATLARKRLEASCLIETYASESKGEEKTAFAIKLFPPLSPKKYFNDKVFLSILATYVGEKKLDELKRRFLKGENISDDFLNVSASFGSVFDVKNLSMRTDKPTEGLEEKKGKMAGSNIDLRRLKKVLKDYQIPFNSIKGNIDDILSVINFYGLDETSAAKLIGDCTNSDNLFLYDKFVDLCKASCKFMSDSYAGDENNAPVYRGSNMDDEYFRLQDKLTIPQFLAARLNIPKVPDPVLDDLLKLKQKYGFSNGVVNNIVDYCLLCNDEILPNFNYYERVAASILADHPKSAYECCILLKKQHRRFKKKVSKKIAYDNGAIANEETNGLTVKGETKKKSKNDDGDFESGFSDEEQALIDSMMKGV